MKVSAGWMTTLGVALVCAGVAAVVLAKGYGESGGLGGGYTLKPGAQSVLLAVGIVLGLVGLVQVLAAIVAPEGQDSLRALTLLSTIVLCVGVPVSGLIVGGFEASKADREAGLDTTTTSEPEPGCVTYDDQSKLSPTGDGGDCDSSAIDEADAPNQTDDTGVRLVADCIRPVDRPSDIIFTCADVGTVAEDLIWERWGDPVAAADGTLRVKRCEPDCATDDTYVHYTISIEASEIEPCAGGNRYTLITYQFPEESPYPPGSPGFEDPTVRLDCPP